MYRVPDQARFNEYLRAAEKSLAWLYDGMTECKYDLEYVGELYKNFVSAYNLVYRLMFLIECPSDEYNKTSMLRVENLRRNKIRVVDTFANWKKKALEDSEPKFVDDLPF